MGSQRKWWYNPQCLPFALDPKLYNTINGTQTHAFMFGVQYVVTDGLVANSYNTDVPCYVPTRNALYMIPAISMNDQVDGPENTLAT